MNGHSWLILTLVLAVGWFAWELGQARIKIDQLEANHRTDDQLYYGLLSAYHARRELSEKESARLDWVRDNTYLIAKWCVDDDDKRQLREFIDEEFSKQTKGQS
jgi:hypothetical protein